MPIGSQPGFLNLLQWTLSRLTTGVKQELRISCAYFIPSTRWRRSLARVARRTGRCALLIPKESDVPAVDAATRHLLGSLLKAGVSVYRYGREVLHEKTLIVDELTIVLDVVIQVQILDFLKDLVVENCMGFMLIFYDLAGDRIALAQLPLLPGRMRTRQSTRRTGRWVSSADRRGLRRRRGLSPTEWAPTEPAL